MYEGKEVCQGCSKSGTDKPRYKKTELCKDCESALKSGMAKEKELSNKYVRIGMWPNKSSVNFDDNSLSTFLTQFLEAVHNEHAEHTNHSQNQPFNRHNSHGSKYYIIPEKLVEPLMEFFSTMDDYVNNLRKEIDELPSMSRQAVQDEKDRIYNEGIEKGRNLLFQLNEGTVTQADFVDKKRYNSKDKT